MGVFDRFRRKSSRTSSSTSEDVAEDVVEVTTEEGAVQGPEGGAEKDAEVSGGSGAESLEIPKQQSAEEAADNEAGESARK